MNLEQSKMLYDDYLYHHIANVKKAYQWLVDNHLLDDIFTSDAIADAKKYVDAHDASKYDEEEYTGYRQYFDPTDKEISSDAPAYEKPGDPLHGDREIFKYSWLHHSHKNPHHWEHHILMNEDEPGKVVALLMPEPYVIEMLADWLSFSIAKGDPTEIIDWYNEKKSGLILHPSTRHDVERVLKKIADINKVEFTTFDESYSNLHLNSAIWDGRGCLVDGVADKIKEIANQVIDDLNDNGIPIRLIDTWIVGSNAAYNYSEHSDLDIHLIVDMSVSDNPQLLRTVYDYYKSSFNDKYDITIKGLNVEVYLEDMNTTSISKGIFSVGQDKWLRVPVPDDYVYEVNLEPDLSNLKSEYMDLIAQDDKDKLQEFLDRLYICRKVSLAEDGEFGKLNLIFKEFRNLGYIDSIKSKINELTSKELSLESKGVKSMKKSITEFWDLRQETDNVDVEVYKGLPITSAEIKFKDEKDDDWKHSTAYYVMDPKNPSEHHPDLWDEWCMDLDSLKAKIDEYVGDKSESLNESLYSMLVKCNDGPTIRVKTIASSEDEAQKFAKSMYASEHTTYADDRENKWEITEIHKLESQEGSDMSKLNEGRMSEIDALLTQYKELEDALKAHDFDNPHEGDVISIEMSDLRSEIPNFEEFYKQKFGTNSLHYQINNKSESYDNDEAGALDYIADAKDYVKSGNLAAAQDALNNASKILDKLSSKNESEDEENKINWEYVSSKIVYDDAGFTDDYYWYKGILPDGTEKHIFMYGDDEPDENYADWECDSEKEAQEWFDSYEGTYEDDVVEGLLDKLKNVFSKKGGKDSKAQKYGLYNDFGRLVYGPFDNEDEAEYELNQKAKMSRKYADTLRVYPITEEVDLDSPDVKVDYEVEYVTADNHHESQFYYTKAHNAGEALENCMKDHPGVDVVDVERLGEAPVEESLDELTEATVEVDGDEIVIKGVKGEERFKPINGDPEKTKHSFDGIMKHSVGRAWQWLKKQKPSVTESIEGEVPSAPTGEDAGIITSINSLINEELTASDSYLSAIQYYRASGHEDIAKMLEEVRADEESHVGILYKAKTLLDAQAVVGFDAGVNEANKSLEDGVPQAEVVTVVTEAKVDEIDQNEAKLVTQYRDYDNRMRDYELNHKAWLDDMSRGEEPKEPEKFDGFDKKVYEILKSNGFTSTKISNYIESKSLVRESKFSDEESIDYLTDIDVKTLSADEISDLNKLFSYFGADFGIRSTYAELPSKELSMLANIASDYLGDDTDDDYVRKFTDGSAGGRKSEVTMTGVLNALGESLDFDDDVEVTPNIEGDVNIDVDLELNDEDTPIDPDLDLDDKVDSPIPQFLNNNSIEDDEFNDVEGKKKFLDDQGKVPDLEECDEGSPATPSDPDDDEEEIRKIYDGNANGIYTDDDDEFEDRFESEVGEVTEDKVSYSDLVASAGDILSKEEESLMEVADYKNAEDLYAEIKKYADKGNEEAQYLVDLYNTPRSQREFIREAKAFLKAKKDAKKNK